MWDFFFLIYSHGELQNTHHVLFFSFPPSLSPFFLSFFVSFLPFLFVLGEGNCQGILFTRFLRTSFLSVFYGSAHKGDSDSSIQLKANYNGVFCALFPEQGVLNVNSDWKSLKLKVLCIIYTEEALVWTGKR